MKHDFSQAIGRGVASLANSALFALSMGLIASTFPAAHAATSNAPAANNPAAESVISPRDEILFTSTRHGHLQIYKKQTNGAEVRLGQSDSADLQPAWSPEGKIAFVSYRTGQGDIYTMDANGENVRRLTSRPGLEQQPVWSPNGEQLAFTGENDGKVHVFIVNADGAGERNIAQNHLDASSPAWSPDGRQVAFVANVSGKMRLLLWNSGDDSTRLISTSASGGERDPVWSPDGKTILFSLNGKNSEGVNLATVNVASGEVRYLTSNMYINSSATWSPDGSKIGYLSNADTQGNTMNLNVMNADGTHPVNLTRSESQDVALAWSSDSGHLYFMSFRRWPGQIFSIGADGTQLTRVSSSHGQDGFPVPRPKK